MEAHERRSKWNREILCGFCMFLYVFVILIPFIAFDCCTLGDALISFSARMGLASSFCLAVPKKITKLYCFGLDDDPETGETTLDVGLSGVLN